MTLYFLKCTQLVCWSRLALIAAITTPLSANCASLFPLLTLRAPASVPPPSTYHLGLTWDTVTNATGYAVIVRTNGIEAFRVPTAANIVTISNLSANVDAYRFSCIATNLAGESPESAIAALHWMNVLEANSLAGPWTLLATNSFASTQPQHWITLSNWSAASFLQPD